MDKITKITMTIVQITLIMWVVVIVTINYEILFNGLFVLSAIVLTIASLVLGAFCVLRHLKKEWSPYYSFGLINVILMVIAVCYAIYDLMTDVGMLAGIKGYFTLMYIVPVLAVLLIGDIVLYRIKKKKDASADE